MSIIAQYLKIAKIGYWAFFVPIFRGDVEVAQNYIK